MDLRTDSERNWALDPNQNPKLKENIFIIKLWSIRWFKPQTPIGPNTLFEWVQSVHFY